MIPFRMRRTGVSGCWEHAETPIASKGLLPCVSF
jgi:hypothetical protein